MLMRHIGAGRGRADPITRDFDGNVTLVRILPLESEEASACNSSVECQRHALEEPSFAEPVDSEMTDIQQLSNKSHDSSIESATPPPAPPASTPIVRQRQQQQLCSPMELQRRVDELRRLRPRRFYEICRVHLSFVTDVPADFLQDLIDSCPSGGVGRRRPATAAAASPVRRGLVHRVCSSVRRAAAEPQQPAVEEGDSLNAEILGTVDRLIQLLDGRLDAEGIFRKSGQVGRQRQLRQLVSQELPQLQQSVLDLRCCVHDIATVLKACLGELRQPLLTDRLRPYFLQLAELGRAKTDENGNSLTPAARDVALVAGRQLRGFRILTQLLPKQNCDLLRRLLLLLRRVAELPRTLMSPENLGTVFGPLLLCPREMQMQQHTPGLQRLLSLSNEAVAYMIRHSDEVFNAPEHLALDAARGLEKSRSRSQSSASCADDHSDNNNNNNSDCKDNVDNDDEIDDDDDDDDEAVDLCVSFVDRSRSGSAGDSRDYTQLQVAGLYAAVQAMPEGAKKQALIRRFSAANGGLQPQARGFQRQQQQQQQRAPSSLGRSPFRRQKVCPGHPAARAFACPAAGAKSASTEALPSIRELAQAD